MWARASNIVLGIWLVFAPLVLGYDVPAARSNDIIVGLFLATFALVGATIGKMRFLWVLAIWLIVAPFALGYGNELAPVLNDVLVGIAVLGLSLVPLHRRERVTALQREPAHTEENWGRLGVSRRTPTEA
ncbi:SPW repeat protein [Archangium violaceum]|uniref:SPW repeat domain-containing protein n=1 Tax=Archangium violaceum TaxID=83451 RepID=UPI00194EC226|nr:SPW repeat protein [Archangium violaceum]QRO01903.1 SPW repeat protein [Archangium violaceum]